MLSRWHVDSQPPSTADHWIDLFDLTRFIVRRWPVLVTGAVVGAVLAIIYLNFTTPKYAAALRISSAANGSGGLGASLGQLGGLAAIAGIDVRQGNSASPFDLYLDALRSRQTADTMARDPAIMHHIFSKQWDSATRRWREPPSLTGPAMDALRNLSGQPRRTWRPPNGADLADFIDKRLVVQAPKPKDPPVTTLYLEDPDGLFAAAFLNRINDIADSSVRTRALQRATEYARYLQSRLKTTENAEQVRRLADVLLEQERAIMMANSSVPYAANPSEPAVPTPRPVSPVIPAVIVVGLVVGSLGAVAILIIGFVRKSAPS